MTAELIKVQNGNNLLKFLFFFFTALVLHLMLLKFLGLNSQVKNVSGNAAALQVSTKDLSDLIKNFETPPELRNDIYKYKRHMGEVVESEQHQVKIHSKVSDYDKIKISVNPKAFSVQEEHTDKDEGPKIYETEVIDYEEKIFRKFPLKSGSAEIEVSNFIESSEEPSVPIEISTNNLNTNAHKKIQQAVRYSTVSDDIGLSANFSDNGVNNFDWGEELRILIQNNVIFPKKALSRGLNGIVILEVEVYRDGRIGKVIIQKSSGHDILDQSALKGAKRISSLNSRNTSSSQEVYYLPIKFN
jgi:TonB family protein